MRRGLSVAIWKEMSYLQSLIQILLVLWQQNGIQTRFIQMPQEGGVTAYGAQVRYSCSVEEGYSIEWILKIPDQVPMLSTGSPTDFVRLRRRGIDVMALSSRESHLVINATSRNNQTQAKCASTDMKRPDLPVSYSNNVRITVGPLPSGVVEIVLLTSHEPGMVTVSWVSSARPPYALIAENLDTSESVVIPTLQDTNYTLSVVMPVSCDTYSFRIHGQRDKLTATTPVSSRAVIWSIPTRPEVVVREGSLQHVVSRSQMHTKRAMLNVTFDAVDQCQTYPLSYRIVVLDTEGQNHLQDYMYSEADISGEGGASTVTANIDGLHTDMHLWYYIKATNQYGSTNITTRMKFTTTDVQNATICKSGKSSYIIQCSYMNGTNARGCVYNIYSKKDGLENMNGVVSRSNQNGVEVKINQRDFDDIVYVYDWEENGTNGALPFLLAVSDAHKCEKRRLLSVGASVAIAFVCIVVATSSISVMWALYLCIYEKKCVNRFSIRFKKRFRQVVINPFWRLVNCIIPQQKLINPDDIEFRKCSIDSNKQAQVIHTEEAQHIEETQPTKEPPGSSWWN